MRSDSDPRNRIAWQPETPMSKALWENESLHEAIISTTGSRSSEGRPIGMRARAALSGIVSILGMLLEPGGPAQASSRLRSMKYRRAQLSGAASATIECSHPVGTAAPRSRLALDLQLGKRLLKGVDPRLGDLCALEVQGFEIDQVFQMPKAGVGDRRVFEH